MIYGFIIMAFLSLVAGTKAMAQSQAVKSQTVGDSLFVQMIEVPGVPEKFGLYNPKDERFEVIELNRRRMTLRSKFALLRFRKF